MAAISISSLSKRFDGAERPALAELDLEVEDGELLVLVGPSGCGKSTALRIIAGLEQASGGKVLLDGVDLTNMPPQDRDVAMVFQGYALYPHLSVRENMAFPLKMRGRDKAARTAKVEEIAELVGLSDKLGRLPAELSGGERQRVAMGRAIVREPKVFLFDEPLSNLDAKLRGELRVELTSLVKRLGVTSVYVTHDQAEAMTMGDRVAVMNAGKLQQVAPPRVVYEEPENEFVATFVGTPAMNLMDLPCAGVEVEAAKVGFRPEHVVFSECDGASIETKVIAWESLGPETLVHLRAGEVDLRARLPGFERPESDTITAYVAREHLLFFDDGGRRVDG